MEYVDIIFAVGEALEEIAIEDEFIELPPIICVPIPEALVFAKETLKVFTI